MSALIWGSGETMDLWELPVKIIRWTSVPAHYQKHLVECWIECHRAISRV